MADADPNGCPAGGADRSRLSGGPRPWAGPGPVLAAMALVLLPACGGGGSGSPSTREDMIPLAALVGNQPGGTKTSPDGNWQAQLLPGNGPGRRMNLFVGRSGGPAVQVTHVEDRNLVEFQWLGNDRLAYYREPEGDELRRLWSVNADGSGNRELTPPDRARITAMLVGPEPGNTGYWRMAMGDYTRLDLYRIHPGTGECRLLDRAPEFTLGYLPDSGGRVLLALAFDGRTMTLLHRTCEGEPFRPVVAAAYPEVIYPQMLFPGGTRALVLTNLGTEYTVVRFLDLADGRLGQVVHELPGQDLPMPQSASLAWFPGGIPGNRPPMALHGRWQNPLLETVVPQPVTYPSRDGLTIHAWLYLPRNQGLGRWPGVVYCHGGPTAQHDLRDPWPMVMAARGMAVLCPDFRGSTGYGKSFTALGFGQWGRAMQDDLSDGARWLVESGYAREDRLAIAGASYGGYAALAGAAFTPDLYRCALAFAGPSNLLTFLDSCWTRVQMDFMRLAIGDPVTRRQELADRSPALHADRIRIPVLVAHGGRDVRVSPAQSEEMVRALQAQGAFVPYLTFPEEGHGFSKEENILQFYRVVENFLALHLGSRAEAPAPFRLTP